MNKNNNKDQGFTLVELLIVIVILGILATVTVFAVRGITDQGQASACAADEKTFEVAIETWYAKAATGANARVDATPFGAPSGADLAASGLLREYSTTNQTITEGTSTAVSTVGPTPAGPCVV
jgi:prepilin-type N-terminal cleavage/methylation domain-containing protein